MNSNTTENARVLLVDDDQGFRSTIAILLKKNGYDVTTAGGVGEAVSYLGKNEADLLITDLKMNDGNGLDLLSKAKQITPELAVILLTAHGSVKSAVTAIKQGASDYIDKPFDNEEFLLVVEKTLENRNIRRELNNLREEITFKYSFDNLIGVSPKMENLKSLAARVAATDIAVLITGDSGTGKELLAKAIHYHSSRRKKRFSPIECTSIPENLLESEFFGHVKGAFTNAYNDHKGLFEEANGGTVFLDEVGDMPLNLQSKILRVLQESEIRPVGSASSKKIDVRIIAATNRDLTEMVKEGTFREDLFYRLNVLPIKIPPLRQRIDDISVLAEHFIRIENGKRRGSAVSISTEAMEKMISHRWPGNVRELENTIKRAIALCQENRIRRDDIIFITSDKNVAAPVNRMQPILEDAETLEDSQRKVIEQTLYDNDWNYTKTATKLGIGRTTLWRKIKKYKIRRKEEVAV